MQWRFLVGRLARLVVTLLVSSFVIFSSLYLSPGNPIATLSGGKSLSPQAIATLEKRFHLDDPFFTRYFRWLGGLLRGDFGISIALRSTIWFRSVSSRPRFSMRARKRRADVFCC